MAGDGFQKEAALKMVGAPEAVRRESGAASGA
jgi:hypothetical protein